MYSRAPVPTVYILDDDEAMLDSLGTWLDAKGLKTRTWSDPRSFLDEYRHGLIRERDFLAQLRDHSHVEPPTWERRP